MQFNKLNLEPATAGQGLEPLLFALSLNYDLIVCTQIHL